MLVAPWHVPSLRRVAVIVFFLAHVIAISIEAIPHAATDPVARFLHARVRPVTLPYILATFQWQRWDLFAQPLHDVTEFRIDAWRGGTWGGVAALAPEALPWWRIPPLLKIVRTLAEGGESYRHLRQHLLLSSCVRWHLPAGMPLRLRVRSRDLAEPSFAEEVDAAALCP